MQLRPDRTMKKTTTKKKAAGFARELKDREHVTITTHWAIQTMSTREMKEVMRAHGVPIPQYREAMVVALAHHFDEAGTKVTVQIG